VAIRPICPSARECANRDVRLTVLESELDRLRGLDLIREDTANLLKEEIEELKRKLVAAEQSSRLDRMRQVKVVISKALHPNNLRGDPGDERVRSEIFKEIWPEIERIERG
jgi:hypothetical protein